MSFENPSLCPRRETVVVQHIEGMTLCEKFRYFVQAFFS